MMDADRAEDDKSSRPKPLYVRALTFFAAFMMFCMMTLTFADVVGRYVFNAPIGATFEIIEMMLGMLIFSALPLVSRDQGHITVDLFERFFQGSLKWLQQLFVLIFSAAAMMFITYRMWAEMVTMRSDQDVGEYLDLELWPFIGIISFMGGVTSLILTHLVYKFLKGELVEKDESADLSGDIL
jgi:TRAP-type transport system small permease protein